MNLTYIRTWICTNYYKIHLFFHYFYFNIIVILMNKYHQKFIPKLVMIINVDHYPWKLLYFINNIKYILIITSILISSSRMNTPFRFWNLEIYRDVKKVFFPPHQWSFTRFLKINSTTHQSLYGHFVRIFCYNMQILIKRFWTR